MDFSARLVLVCETTGANHPFIDVINLRGIRISIYNNIALVRNLRYKHVPVTHLPFAISVKNMQVLVQEGTATSWNQIQISQISSGTALREPLYKSGFNP